MPSKAKHRRRKPGKTNSTTTPVAATPSGTSTNSFFTPLRLLVLLPLALLALYFIYVVVRNSEASDTAALSSAKTESDVALPVSASTAVAKVTTSQIFKLFGSQLDRAAHLVFARALAKAFTNLLEVSHVKALYERLVAGDIAIAFGDHDSGRDSVMAFVGTVGEKLQMTFTRNVVGADQGRLEEVISHEARHAAQGWRNLKSLQLQCKSGTLPWSKAWHAPFYPRTPDAITGYVGLLQKGIDRIFRILDLDVKNAAGEALTVIERFTLTTYRELTRDYVAKQLVMPFDRASYFELLSSTAKAALAKGDTVKVMLGINKPGSLLKNKEGGTVNLPFFVSKAYEKAAADGSVLFLVEGSYDGGDPFRAWCFDQLTADDRVSSHQRTLVMHPAELDAHQFEGVTQRNLEKLQRMAFKEVYEYHDRLDSHIEKKVCPEVDEGSQPLAPGV